MKRLYIIAGPNGAGKTTVSYTVLPEIFDCKEFVNADEIARGISPFNPEAVSIQAGRLMLKRLNELMDKKETFAFETTLSSVTFIDFIRKAQSQKYEVILLFLMLNSVNLAYARVETRVKEGGHNIPKEIIKRRFVKGLKNFFSRYYTIVDKWFLVDNSGDVFQFIAEGTNNEIIFKNKRIWSELIKKYHEH